MTSHPISIIVVCLVLWILLCFCSLSWAQQTGQNDSDSLETTNNDHLLNSEARLVHYLLSKLPSGEHSAVRPVKNVSQPVVVHVDIIPFHILEFDQTKQKLTTQAWLRMSWHHIGISWDPDDYDGIRSLPVDPKYIWQPDIFLLNNYGTEPARSPSPVKIWFDGNVTWLPMLIMHTFCEVHLYDFPYDRQMCPFHLGSWISPRPKMRIKAASDSLDFGNYIENIEWEVYNSTVIEHGFTSTCCSEDFDVVSYELYLRRRSSYYSGVLLLPVIVLSVMSVFVFCIPAQRPDRTSIGLSLYTSFILLLVLVVDLSPPSEATRLSTYLIVCVGIVTSCIMVSIVLIHVSTWRGDVPKCVEKVLFERLGKALFPFEQWETKEGRASVPPWVLCVNIVDRLLFVVYLSILVVCIALYFPMKSYSSEPPSRIKTATPR